MYQTLIETKVSCPNIFMFKAMQTYQCVADLVIRVVHQLQGSFVWPTVQVTPLEYEPHGKRYIYVIYFQNW